MKAFHVLVGQVVIHCMHDRVQEKGFLNRSLREAQANRPCVPEADFSSLNKEFAQWDTVIVSEQGQSAMIETGPIFCLCQDGAIADR